MIGVTAGPTTSRTSRTLLAASNGSRFDQLIVTGPIGVRATCAHHPMPIHGGAQAGQFIMLKTVPRGVALADTGGCEYAAAAAGEGARRAGPVMRLQSGPSRLASLSGATFRAPDVRRRSVEPVPSPAATRCGAAKAKEYGW